MNTIGQHELVHNIVEFFLKCGYIRNIFTHQVNSNIHYNNNTLYYIILL